MNAADAAALPPPPFCAELLAELAKGKPATVRLFCGRDAQRLADIFRETFGPAAAASWPADADPLAFRWPAGGELTALCLGHSARAVALRRALVAALIRDGVRFVLICGDGQSLITRVTRGTAVTQ